MNPFGDDPVDIPLTDVFDLHSIPNRDVQAALEGYLEEARHRGWRFVRIIHGRGIGARRDQTRRLLARLPYVASFADAPLNAGGWGATVVTLTVATSSEHAP